MKVEIGFATVAGLQLFNRQTDRQTMEYYIETLCDYTSDSGRIRQHVTQHFIEGTLKEAQAEADKQTKEVQELITKTKLDVNQGPYSDVRTNIYQLLETRA